MYTIARLMTLVFAVSIQVHAQQISSSIEDGGGVVVKAKSINFIMANQQSSLWRTWVTVNDSDCPVALSKTGVNADYSDYFRFTPSGSASVQSDVVAFEVRFLIYDMFGNHIKTLSSTEVEDVSAGNSLDLRGGEWRAWGNEASEFLSSVSFVAYVREANGNIWRYDAE